MVPMNYNEINNWEEMDIWLDAVTPEGKTLCINGRFTSLRVNRDTLPEGMHAYDLRDADGDSELWFSELKDDILVNHAGTFVTENKVKNSEDGIRILDYSFY